MSSPYLDRPIRTIAAAMSGKAPTLTVTVNHGAECDNPAEEAVLVLRDIADQIEAGHLEGAARDENGLVIGEYRLTLKRT